MNEMTEISEAKSNDKSDLDIVRLMEAYGLSNSSPQTSLKQQVKIDEIIAVQDIRFENIVNAATKEFTMPVPVLHGAPTEYDVCTEWEAIDELEPIPLHQPSVHSDGSQYSHRLEHRCLNAKDNTSHCD